MLLFAVASDSIVLGSCELAPLRSGQVATVFAQASLLLFLLYTVVRRYTVAASLLVQVSPKWVAGERERVRRGVGICWRTVRTCYDAERPQKGEDRDEN